MHTNATEYPRILVTGSSGYVGSNLVPALEARGYAVRCFDQVAPASGTRGALVHDGVCSAQREYVTGSVLEPAQVDEAMRGVDGVIHLAAAITLKKRDPQAWRLNSAGPGVVARSALKHHIRMVHCSSVHALDNATKGVITEKSPPAGPDRPLYDRSKAAGNRAVRRQIARGLDAVVCMPTGIIGPTDPTQSRVNEIISDAARGRVPAVVAGGFDWVDVRDVAGGLIDAFEKGQTSQQYLLPGVRASMSTLVRIASALAGHSGRAVPVFPLRWVDWLAPVGEKIGSWVNSDIFTSASLGALEDLPHVSGAKARNEWDYQPRSLAVTIRDLLVDVGINVVDDPGAMVEMRRDLAEV